MVVELLRPARGGFLRPFGCGWFIRELLLGNAPYGSPVIDPDVGARVEAEKVSSQTEVVLGPVEIRLPPKFPVTNEICLLNMVISYEIAGCVKQQTKTLLKVGIRELFRSMLDDIESIS